MKRAVCTSILLTAIAGCGGAAPPPPESSEAGGDAPRRLRSKAAPSIETEIGAMDEERTQKIFQRASTTLARCISTGRKRIPYLAGEIRLAVRVNAEGATRWAYVKESTLGDRETEECMLGVMKSTVWPKPEGGDGLAENLFTFEPDSDERSPVDWDPSKVEKAMREAQGDLSACRKGAGTGPLKATLYIAPEGKEGKVVSVGVSGSDERAEGAARCVVDAIGKLKLPSPGSYDAKVSVDIE